MAHKSEKYLAMNDSYELELDESRKIIEDLTLKLKESERDKEELLLSNHQSNNNIDIDTNEVLDHLRTYIENIDNNNEQISSLSKNGNSMQIIKQLFDNYQENFTNMEKSSTKDSHEVDNLNETLSYLNEQLKHSIARNASIEDENHFLKKKMEELETNYNCGIQELDMLQNRLKALEKERDSNIEEIIELKGDRNHIQNHYHNTFDNENEKLISKVEQLEMEKDKAYSDLNEQMKKTNIYFSHCKELEYNSEVLENTITNLKREYVNVTREMNTLSQENEELKKNLQDAERESTNFKRNKKLIETSNNDLEDQLIHLTSQNQNLKSNNDKLRASITGYNTMIKELETKLESKKLEKLSLDNELKRCKMENLELQDAKDTKPPKKFASNISLEDESTDENIVILEEYEKLLMNLLHQRKEIFSLMGLNATEPYKKIYTELSPLLSTKCKFSSEMKNHHYTIFSYIDTSYTSMSNHLQMLHNSWNFAEVYLKDLWCFMHCVQTQDEDSSYYTDDEDNVLTENYENDCKIIDQLRNMPVLVGKIKKFYKRAILLKEKLSTLKYKSKKSKKIIRRLQLRQKHLKSSNNIKKKKMLNLSKKMQYLHTPQHVHHKNHFNNTFESHIEEDAPVNHSPVNHPPVNHRTSFDKPHLLLTELTCSLTNTEQMLEEALKSVHKPSDLESKEEIIGDFKKLQSCLSSSRNMLVDHIQNVLNLRSSKSETSLDTAGLSEQREYLMEHVKFTNKRLEVLLKCWKGKEEIKIGTQLDENGLSGSISDSISKHVSNSFKSDEDISRRAIDVLEITKAISMTELNQIPEDKAMDKGQLEVIQLIKKMNENMESVLREARLHTIDNKRISASTMTLVDDNMAATGTGLLTKYEGITSPSKGTFSTLKRESKLKMILENTEKRVRDLSEYLKQREDDLKERDEMIAKLSQEYAELKGNTNERHNSKSLKEEQIIAEYGKAKARLEKEHEVLRMVVKGVQEELLSLQKECEQEENCEMVLQELVDELESSKLSLEQSLDKMASELNIVKRDKEYLMQSLHLAGIANMYKEPCYGTPYSPAANIRNNMHTMYDYPPYNTECQCVYCMQNSEGSTQPFSDEEWVSAVSCDEDCDSVISDHEHLDVISSSESQTTACSRLAKNIKTSEATERIKSQNRPARYLRKETRNRKSLSPKYSAANINDTSNTSDTSSLTNASLVSKDSRVLGRRESSMRCRRQTSSVHEITPSFRATSASITSQESETSSPLSIRSNHQRETVDYSNETIMNGNDDSWNDTDVSPFLNTRFDGKKRKKKFLQFRKR